MSAEAPGGTHTGSLFRGGTRGHLERAAGQEAPTIFTPQKARGKPFAKFALSALSNDNFIRVDCPFLVTTLIVIFTLTLLGTLGGREGLLSTRHVTFFR